jgi:hypothetical protein
MGGEFNDDLINSGAWTGREELTVAQTKAEHDNHLMKVIADAQTRMHAEELKRQWAMSNTLGGNLIGSWPTDKIHMPDKLLTLEERIATRLFDGNAAARLPFDMVKAWPTPTKVFIFVVQGEQATVLEDDKSLFPSDKLITQLRLI